MSKEGERASVFLSTKVRTKLKGDGSWMQCHSDPEPEGQEEKPWMAEVRARHLNGDPDETTPVSSPVIPAPSPATPAPSPATPAPSPAIPAAERAPTSGYLIRGVFKKTENKPATRVGGTTTILNKRPSDNYRKIAPHTVRPSSESPDRAEDQLSHEEQEKRTEAARNVLRNSATRRSYVLSAAKKFETSENAPDATGVNGSPSFVAKRVDITDDDDDEPAEAAASPPPPSSSSSCPPAVPVAPPVALPRRPITTETKVEAAVDEPVAPTVEDVPPVEEALPLVCLVDHPPVDAPNKDLFKHMKPGCTKVATPLPVLLPEYVVQVCSAPEPVKEEAPPLVCLVDHPPPVDAPNEDPFKRVTPGCTKVATLLPVLLLPEYVVQVCNVPEPESGPEPESEPSPNQSVDTLAALSDTLICFDTSPASLLDAREQNGGNNHTLEENEPTAPVPDSFRDDAAAPAQEDADPEDHHTVDGVEREPSPEHSLGNCVDITDDLLALGDGPKDLADSIPPSPGRWSQDLLSGPDSLLDPMQTSSTLDLLADDVIPINTGMCSLSSERKEEEKQTDEAAQDAQRSSDPLLPLSALSINSCTDRGSPTDFRKWEPPSSEISMSGTALDDLAGDLIHINTNATSLSTPRSWARTWDPRPSEASATESRSAEKDSPWDRWTLPTATTEEEEEEEEEEEDEEEEEKERETHGNPESAMDRYQSHSNTVDRGDDQRAQTPEADSKKGFVFVKEYNTPELPLHNGRDDRGLTPIPCTYCGEPVGNDAKISIEHINIHCHPDCFKCGVCSKPMGDLLYSMFLHHGKVHCESCYSGVFDSTDF